MGDDDGDDEEQFEIVQTFERLQARIYHHTLWNRAPFWEALMYLKVSEAWQAYALEKFSFRKIHLNVAGSEEKKKNLDLLRPEVPPWELCPALIEDLLTYGKLMHSYGIKKNEVLELFAKTIKQHCDHMLPEMQDKYLDKLKDKFRGSVPMSPAPPAASGGALVAVLAPNHVPSAE